MATPHLTPELLLQLDETEPASEYACGEVLQKPMPNVPHAAIQVFLGAVLLQFLSRTGLGQVFTELRSIFGPPGEERTYVPDIAYVANDHLPEGPYLRTAPDLAIEILSPDQDLGRFLDKIQFYLRHGVRLAWVIDPTRMSITVLVPGHDARILTADAVLDGGDVLSGFSIPIADIFARTQVRRPM